MCLKGRLTELIRSDGACTGGVCEKIVLVLFLQTARCPPSAAQFGCICSQPTVNIAQVSAGREVQFQGNPRFDSAAFFQEVVEVVMLITPEIVDAPVPRHSDETVVEDAVVISVPQECGQQNDERIVAMWMFFRSGLCPWQRSS